ncbi:general substrate transporter [Apiospora saccharicola]
MPDSTRETDMYKVGRKAHMLYEVFGMLVLLLITGFTGIHTPPLTAEAWTAVIMVVLPTAVFDFSVRRIDLPPGQQHDPGAQSL